MAHGAAGGLGHETHREVCLTPVTRTSGRRFRLGAAGPDGRFIAGFGHRWCAEATDRPPGAVARLAGTSVYGGLAMSHFGHFVLEALCRLWFLRRHPDLPVVWHWIDLPVPHTAWGGWLPEVLRLTGLGDRRHVVLRAPLEVEEIALPQPGFRTHAQFHQDQADALAVVRGGGDAPGGRVWLSRRGLPAAFGRIEGEAALEQDLVARGWTVVRPETLPVATQAGVFAAAEVVSGFAGSAFHAVALQAAPRARLRPVIRPAVPMRDHEIIAAARGIDLRAVPVAMTPLDSRASWTSYRIDDPAALAGAVHTA